MSVVHYKFKNAVEYSKIVFNGPYISLNELISEIGVLPGNVPSLAIVGVENVEGGGGVGVSLSQPAHKETLLFLHIYSLYLLHSVLAGTATSTELMHILLVRYFFMQLLIFKVLSTCWIRVPN